MCDKKEGIVHHIHHKEDAADEYKREVTIQGINTTVALSSNFPEENLDYLCNKALSVFNKIKEANNHEER
jgi:hypothetical protein